jgi:hypothetical protein
LQRTGGHQLSDSSLVDSLMQIYTTLYANISNQSSGNDIIGWSGVSIPFPWINPLVQNMKNPLLIPPLWRSGHSKHILNLNSGSENGSEVVERVDENYIVA